MPATQNGPVAASTEVEEGEIAQELTKDVTKKKKRQAKRSGRKWKARHIGQAKAREAKKYYKPAVEQASAQAGANEEVIRRAQMSLQRVGEEAEGEREEVKEAEGRGT